MRYLFSTLLAALFAGLLLIGQSPAEGAPAEPPPLGQDIQARGPVHEAYAEPTTSTGVAGTRVGKEPPRLIEEAPPDEKPAGDNIVWIPGYWSWDDESKDYLWISGFCGAPPPNRTWTPGHWQTVADGWQWVSGFWATVESTETEYLPAPPAPLDRGPTVPAAQATDTYVPGIWLYQTNRYVWRPGYWVGYRPGWVWTPSFYRWTPGGYIYVSGYWDVPLLDRGLLFAPVRFTAAVLTPTFVYRPRFVIQPDFLCGALFVRVGRPCFYFGNYFEPRYQRNYVSWVNYRVGRTAVIDVNFSYYRAAYAKYPDWERNLRTLYTGRYGGTIARPPLTLAAQTKVIGNITLNKTSTVVVHKNVAITNLQNVSVLKPISKVSTVRVTAMASLASNKPGFVKTAPVRSTVRVEKISSARAVEERKSVDRYRTIARERRSAEVTVIKRPPTTAPVRVKATLPKNTPPARVIVHPKAPPPPNRPKVKVKVEKP